MNTYNKSRVGVLLPSFGGKRGVTIKARKKGGACPCQAAPQGPIMLKGGYKPTMRNKKYLRKWRKGIPIGFTMRSYLKAKGLIPRSNGTYKVSPKYRTK